MCLFFLIVSCWRWRETRYASINYIRADNFTFTYNLINKVDAIEIFWPFLSSVFFLSPHPLLKTTVTQFLFVCFLWGIDSVTTLLTSHLNQNGFQMLSVRPSTQVKVVHQYRQWYRLLFRGNGKPARMKRLKCWRECVDPTCIILSCKIWNNQQLYYLPDPSCSLL